MEFILQVIKALGIATIVMVGATILPFYILRGLLQFGIVVNGIPALILLLASYFVALLVVGKIFQTR